NPQAAEVALARATVTVRVDERVGDLLLRLAVQARTLTTVAGCALKDDAALLVGVDGPLYSCHFSFLISSASALLAEESLDGLGIGGSHNLVLVQPALALTRLDLQVVAHAGLLLHYLAAAGALEALLR